MLQEKNVTKQFEQHYRYVATFIEVLAQGKDTSGCWIDIRMKYMNRKTTSTARFIVNDNKICFPPLSGYTSFVKIITQVAGKECRLFIKEREISKVLKQLHEIHQNGGESLSSLRVSMRKVNIKDKSYRYHKHAFDRIQSAGLELLNNLENAYKQAA